MIIGGAMEYLHNLDIVAATVGDDGVARFLDVEGGAARSRPGELESVWFWESPGIPTLPHSVGGVPSVMNFPAPGGTIVGLVCFPPHSAGRRSLGESDVGQRMHTDGYSDPAMHRTDTVDFEFIISGKIDYVLPSGETRTLGPGSCLIAGGVGHSWQNRYDEPCIYAAVVVGANGTVTDE